jgi:hypothetical protein
MRTVVEGIPTLLHTAVFLFLVCLVDYLFSINTSVARAVLRILVIWSTFYLIITLLPAIYLQSPYYTPLSGVFWRIRHILAVFRSPNMFQYSFMASWKNRVVGSIAEAQIMPDNYHSVDRSLQAIRWTTESLIEDAEFEPFVEGITECLPMEYLTFTSTIDKYVMQELLFDPQISLLPRIIRLLTSNARQRAEKQKDKRDITCMKAIASLLSLLDLDDSRSYQLISSVVSDFVARFAVLKQSSQPDVASAAIGAIKIITVKLKEIIYHEVYRYRPKTSGFEFCPQAAWVIMETLDAWGSADVILGMVPTMVRQLSREPSAFFKQCVLYLHRFLLPFYQDEDSKLRSATTADRQAFILAFMKAIYLTINHFDYCQAPGPTYITPTYITRLLAEMQNDNTPLLAHYANCINARFACHLQGDIILLYKRNEYTNIPCHLRAIHNLCVLDDLDGGQDLQRELTLWYSDMRYHARTVQDFWDAAGEPLWVEYRSKLLPEELESFGKFQVHTTGGSVTDDFPIPGKVFLSQGYTVILITFLKSMTRSPLPDSVLGTTLDTLEFITRNLIAHFSSHATQQHLVGLVGEVTKSLLEDLGRQTELNATMDKAVPILDELKYLPPNNIYAQITHSPNSSSDNQSFDSGKYSKYPYNSLMAVEPTFPETDQSAHHAPVNIVKTICALLRILSTVANPDCIEDAKKVIQLVLDSHDDLDQDAREAGLEALRKVCMHVPTQIACVLI